jgi:DNA-binding winged helix-turn-helix (wHTH) protein
VPNRGYQFTAELTRKIGQPATPSAAPLRVKGTLPAPSHRAFPDSIAPMVTRPHETAAPTAEDLIHFGPFSLHPMQRVLKEGDTHINLGSRAFDILLLLIKRAGTFVAKNDIFEAVWPGAVVVEGNLPVHVAALRKALGDGRDDRRFIVNAPNRGYSFVAPLSHRSADAPRSSPDAPDRATSGLMAPLHRIARAGCP